MGKEEVEKVMISFWAARGSPGSQVITQGSEEDPTIIDSSRGMERQTPLLSSN